MALSIESSRVTTDVSTDTANVAEALLNSVVLIRVGRGSGSGVVWDADGLIVTNNHVAHSDNVGVVLRNGTRLQGNVIARDPGHDLAALRVDARGLPAARIGDSTRVHVGQLVLAVGNPFGMQGVVTAGIVTGVGQVTGGNRTRMDDLIQADVALAPGNSGGPLADAAGRVLGINAMIGASGIALAIPAQVVQKFLSPHRTTEAYMGIQGMPVLPRVAGKQRSGLLLTAVEDGSPAERAGLLQGDVVLGFDGQDVETEDEFQNRLFNLRSGEAVRLAVLRGGEPREFTVVPTARADM